MTDDDVCCDASRDTGHLLHAHDCPAENARLQRLRDDLENYARYHFLRDKNGRPIL